MHERSNLDEVIWYNLLHKSEPYILILIAHHQNPCHNRGTYLLTSHQKIERLLLNSSFQHVFFQQGPLFLADLQSISTTSSPRLSSFPATEYWILPPLLPPYLVSCPLYSYSTFTLSRFSLSDLNLYVGCYWDTPAFLCYTDTYTSLCGSGMTPRIQCLFWCPVYFVVFVSCPIRVGHLYVTSSLLWILHSRYFAPGYSWKTFLG